MARAVTLQARTEITRRAVEKRHRQSSGRPPVIFPFARYLFCSDDGPLMIMDDHHNVRFRHSNGMRRAKASIQLQGVWRPGE